MPNSYVHSVTDKTMQLIGHDWVSLTSRTIDTLLLLNPHISPHIGTPVYVNVHISVSLLSMSHFSSWQVYLQNILPINLINIILIV